MDISDVPMDGTDRQLLFDFIDSCHVKTRRIEEDVVPKLRRVLAHQMFAYGTIDFGADRRLRYVGGNFPETLVDEGAGNRRRPFYCLVKEWLTAREPVYSEGQSPHTRQVLAVHGVADAAQRSATWYAFSKDNFSARDDYIVRVAVPHLHSAVAAASYHVKVPAGLEPLTRRELEVLQWLSKGKANAEISMVLGISICTVRVHIQNIFNKLPANNRTHAAARAMQLGLIEAARPSRESMGFIRPLAAE